MQQFGQTVSEMMTRVRIPNMRWADIVEILLIAFLVYHIMIWVKNTRAYSFLRGVLVIIAFVIFAYVFEMNTIIWIVENFAGLAVTAIVIILQPELRNAMEELGQKNLLSSVLWFDSGEDEGGRFSDKTVSEIVRACSSMARVKTGALIVIECNTPLGEYERTGIDIDAIVTSQLLINIFEKNTPLHDGAVIIRGDRVVSATCYLPLSDNKLDKDLGTRHRAGVGISEVTDSLTIIVSEETGAISVASKGKLIRSVDAAGLKDELVRIQNKNASASRRGILLPWIGRDRDE